MCNLLSVDSVARFSIGSHVIYMPNDETIITLNVTDAPKGIYSFTIIPEITNVGAYEKYNLVIESEFDCRLKENAIATTDYLVERSMGT